MIRNAKIIWLFYRNLAPFTVATSFATWIVFGVPTLSSPTFTAFLLGLFWIKLVANTLTGLLWRSLNRQGFYFYQHLGWSERQLFLAAFGADFVIFLLIVSALSLF
ncbi:MAG: hypothetical protein LH606_20810 [Cytophagaceae bacterium]|nr:hypothetical protein [Cytophagaceae bacterium]